MSKIGICPVCNKGPKKIPYLHPDGTGQNICHACNARIKRYRAKGISRSLPIIKTKKEENLEGRKIKYPDKESVEAALKTRAATGKENYLGRLAIEDVTLYRAVHKFGANLPRKESQERKPTTARKTSKPARLAKPPTVTVVPSPAPARTVVPSRSIEEREENAKKPGREPKYPTRESVIEALETREVQGKENFPSVLGIENVSLYQTALRFEVELPRKENPLTIYFSGDLVRNQNPKDSGIYGKIGTVISNSDKEVSNDKEVRVDFKEHGDITRVYVKWHNLNNIVLHARNPRRLAEKAKTE